MKLEVRPLTWLRLLKHESKGSLGHCAFAPWQALESYDRLEDRAFSGRLTAANSDLWGLDAFDFTDTELVDGIHGV